MSEQKHTQEPWFIGTMKRVGAADNNPVFDYAMLCRSDAENEANARRIVACVNACAGLDTGLLENIVDLGDSLRSRFDSFGRVECELTNERDDLQRELAQVKAAMKAQADGLVKQRDELVAEKERTCTWTHCGDDDMPGTWDGSCGAKWTFTEDGPVENSMKFCPECGGKVAIASVKGGE